ncbi:MAG: twin-arginine translocase TatA/TatE family subunit [Atopobium sp.]|nr:twin-arginine translocase TatA/TatE family subunit [Atopobium sp.]MBS4870418.1 twin-arginine translocase TatA/TatE family subunit [Atopobium sp.]
MFGIGETELVLILLFAFLVFGPDKLPGMGRTLGRALRQFQNAQEGFNKVVRADLLDPAADALHEKPKRSEQLKNAASDADREDTDHQETFAERRARLKEEREAAEKAAAEAAEQSKQAEQTQEAEQPETASAEEAPAAPQATSSVAFSDDSTEVTEYVAPQAAEETPAAPSAKDLYNLGSARSSRSMAEDKKEEVAGEEGESQDA